MLGRHRLKVGMITALTLLVLGLTLCMGTQAEITIGGILATGGIVLWVVCLWAYLEGKGYAGPWALVSLYGFLPAIILLLLPAKSEEYRLGRRLLRQAEGLRASGRIDEAVSVYRQILQECPNSRVAEHATAALAELHVDAADLIAE